MTIAAAIRAVLADQNLVLCRYPDTTFPVDDERLDVVLAQIEARHALESLRVEIERDRDGGVWSPAHGERQ